METKKTTTGVKSKKNEVVIMRKIAKRIVSAIFALAMSASVCMSMPASAELTQEKPVFYYSRTTDSESIPIYVSGRTFQTEILADGKAETVNMYFGFTNPAVEKTNGKFVVHMETAIIFEFAKDISAREFQLAKIAYQPIVNNMVQNNDIFNITAANNTSCQLEKSSVHDGDILTIYGNKTSYNKGELAALVFETNVPLSDLYFFQGWEILYVNGLPYQKQYVGNPLTGDMVKTCVEDEFLVSFINNQLVDVTRMTATALSTEPDTAKETVISVETGVPVPVPFSTDSFLKGDCTGDGAVNILDVIVLNKYILGNGTLQNKQTADMNADNTISADDILLLLKAVTGQK